MASENPLIFWYQACQELPLTEKQSIELLTAPTIIEAFHLLIKILEEKVVSNRFVCSTCYQDLAFTGDLITVAGAPGRIGAYVNPHGVVHQTITFRKLINSARIMLQGGITTQDSWFPGYGWTILYCECYNHLGWKFTAVQSEEDDESGSVNMGAKYFWGIRMGAVEQAKPQSRRSNDEFLTGILVSPESDDSDDDDDDDDDGNNPITVTLSDLDDDYGDNSEDDDDDNDDGAGDFLNDVEEDDGNDDDDDDDDSSSSSDEGVVYTICDEKEDDDDESCINETN